MESVAFSVLGTPTPKGSFTRMPHGGMVPAGTVESRKRMDQWRMDVRNAARYAMDNQPPLEGPLRLFVEFALLPPKSIPKAKQGWKLPTTKPDVDKLLRMMADALTGIVYRDDSQLVAIALNKRYAWDNQPGAEVSVEVINEETAKALAIQTQHIRNVIRTLEKG